MRVDVDVAAPLEREVEPAVARGLLQHVVQERQVGRDLHLRAAIERQLAAQLGLVRATIDGALAEAHRFAPSRSPRSSIARA
jgi:hypothetical protein